MSEGKLVSNKNAAILFVILNSVLIIFVLINLYLLKKNRKKNSEIDLRTIQEINPSSGLPIFERKTTRDLMKCVNKEEL